MSILKRLSVQHVFSVVLSTSKTELTIIEECNHFFTDKLSKREVGLLIKEFQKIHRGMV